MTRYTAARHWYADVPTIARALDAAESRRFALARQLLAALARAPWRASHLRSPCSASPA